MSALGLKVIDSAVESANVWINEVDAVTGWDHKQRAYRLLRQVLHVIRDHLGVDEAAQLGAQLPVLIRGIYYEGWNPSRTPVVERRADGFVAQVQAAFDTDPMGDAPEAIRAVLTVMETHVSSGEMEQVKRTFSKEIQVLWAAPGQDEA